MKEECWKITWRENYKSEFIHSYTEEVDIFTAETDIVPNSVTMKEEPAQQFHHLTDYVFMSY